jgi:hypothetical protein
VNVRDGDNEEGVGWENMIMFMNTKATMKTMHVGNNKHNKQNKVHHYMSFCLYILKPSWCFWSILTMTSHGLLLETCNEAHQVIQIEDIIDFTNNLLYRDQLGRYYE